MQEECIADPRCMMVPEDQQVVRVRSIARAYLFRCEEISCA